MRFLTESETLYEIKDGYWYRLSSTERSGKTRTNFGKIVGVPLVEPGKPAVILDDDVQEGCTHHALLTSRVVLVQT